MSILGGRCISKIILVFLVCFLLVHSLHSGSIRAANLETTPIVYSNQSPVIINLETDADSINYRLSLQAKLIKENSLKLENSRGVFRNVTLNFANLAESEYELLLILKDNVWNQSTKKIKLIVDRTAPVIELTNIRLCESNICASLLSKEAIKLTINESTTDSHKVQDLTTSNSNITITLLDNWELNQKYIFSFTAQDLAGNITKLEYQRFQTPEVGNGAGEVFGVTPQEPWGKSNNFSNQLVQANLEIDNTQAQITTKFTNFWIPEPVLTGSTSIDGGWQVYVNTVSPKMLIQLRVDIIIPSYYQALKLCGLSEVYHYLKPFLATDIDCLKTRLHIPDLNQLWQRSTAICSDRFFPWEIKNCLDSILSLGTRTTEIVKTSSIGAVTLDFLNNQLKLIQPVRIQETKTKSELKINQVDDTRLIRARSNIWGEFNYQGVKFVYGAQSPLSNSLQLSLNSASKAPSGSICQNQACRVLDLFYTNQWVNSKGKYLTWLSWDKDAGGKSCGAASAVMALNYFQSWTKNSDILQTYIFQDNNQSLSSKKCNKPGAFAVTAYDKNCNQSSLESIRSYFKQYHLQTKVHWPDQSAPDKFVTEVIKPGLEKKHLFILAYKKPIGHILLIKGITYNNRLVVNDPYRDIQNNYRKGIYDYSGKEAIYQLRPNNNFQINYLIEVY